MSVRKYTIKVDSVTEGGLICENYSVHYTNPQGVHIPCKVVDNTITLEVDPTDGVKCIDIVVNCESCANCPPKTFTKCFCEDLDVCGECESCVHGLCEPICSDSQYCLSGDCVGCLSDDNCTGGQICIQGTCTCPTGLQYVNQNNDCVECIEDVQCPDCHVCLGFECIPQDCQNGVCQNGLCVECINAGDCGVNSTCVNNECQCNSGYTFNPQTGLCEVNPDCVFDTDCSDCENCQNGDCVPQICPTGLVCSGGVCYTPCSTVAECPNGFGCYNGLCLPCSEIQDLNICELVDGCTSVNGTCVYKVCPTGQTCLGGECVTLCVSGTDCPQGFGCQDGVCVPCTSNNNCQTLTVSNIGNVFTFVSSLQFVTWSIYYNGVNIGDNLISNPDGSLTYEVLLNPSLYSNITIRSTSGNCVSEITLTGVVSNVNTIDGCGPVDPISPCTDSEDCPEGFGCQNGNCIECSTITTIDNSLPIQGFTTEVGGVDEFIGYTNTGSLPTGQWCVSETLGGPELVLVQDFNANEGIGGIGYTVRYTLSELPINQSVVEFYYIFKDSNGSRGILKFTRDNASSTEWTPTTIQDTQGCGYCELVEGCECVDGDCVTANPIPLLGCTEPTACNYDAAATIDDGSCRNLPEISPLTGCVACGEDIVFDLSGIPSDTFLLIPDQPTLGNVVLDNIGKTFTYESEPSNDNQIVIQYGLNNTCGSSFSTMTINLYCSDSTDEPIDKICVDEDTVSVDLNQYFDSKSTNSGVWVKGVCGSTAPDYPTIVLNNDGIINVDSTTSNGLYSFSYIDSGNGCFVCDDVTVPIQKMIYNSFSSISRNSPTIIQAVLSFQSADLTSSVVSVTLNGTLVPPSEYTFVILSPQIRNATFNSNISTGNTGSNDELIVTISNGDCPDKSFTFLIP